MRIAVTRGTIIRDAETDEVIADLTEPDARIVIAKGGKGGWGNTRFKKAPTKRHQFGPGEDGTARQLRLDLKLIADVGIVNFPNAGKSTLLSRITAADPKIGAYPFTTLEPQLGVVYTSGDRDIVVADIPGLIEGAAEGHGLGINSYDTSNVAACCCIWWMVLMATSTTSSSRSTPWTESYKRFSALLAEKPQVIVLNKSDLRPELSELAKTVGAALADQLPALVGSAAMACAASQMA